MSGFWFGVSYCLANIVLCMAVKGVLFCLNPKWSEDKLGCYALLLLIFISIIFFFFGIIYFEVEIKSPLPFLLYIPMMIINLILLGLEKYKTENDFQKEKYDLIINSLNEKYASIIKENDWLKEQYEKLKNGIIQNHPNLAEFTSDLKLWKYSLSIDYLSTKIRPAEMEALRIVELKKKTRGYLTEYKLMKYEYETLFELFPELENYIERLDGSDTEEQSLEDVKADYDWSIKWLSEEEYHNLPVDERNQLALNRYIESRKKSKWQIGRDYEMYIGYLYEDKGYKVTYTGIEKKLEDMGRDLIAENDKEVLIIQCKHWSKDKVIHEKHICQLYGTTIHYKKTNNIKKSVKPVFVTQTSLSDTAKDFADYLKVKVFANKELEEFPRIKCNIGKGGEKIYHLPFDQQYDRTIIDKTKGEFFAATVAEAVEHGFRRAKKYNFCTQT